MNIKTFFTYKRILYAAACIVVFATVYSLILPAITMERKTYCGLEEHTHSEACYETTETCVCGQEESEGHEHTDACYTKEKILVCELEENDDHSHTEDCYETDKILTCGKQETPGHTHTEKCFETNTELICGKEEHVHTDECFVNPETETASEETAETKNTEETAAADAAAEEGTAEETAETQEETTAEEAGEETAAEETSFAQILTAEGKDYHITVACSENAGVPEGAGLVVTEIKNDSADYDGYISDTEKTLDVETGTVSYARFFDIRIVDENDDEIQPAEPVQVVITLDDLAENTEEENAPQIVHFGEETEEIRDVELTTEKAAAEEKVNEEREANKEGNEDTEQEAEDAPLDTVCFAAEGFSVYGVVYTVDFHYDVDGQTYEYNLTGGAGISLRELLTILKVISDDPETENDEVQKFMEAVEDVTFSSPELVWLGQVKHDNTILDIKEYYELACEYSAEMTEEEIAEINAKEVAAGDWAIISLKPFTSEERLTVRMQDGQEFMVAVTDAQQVTDSAAFQASERFVIAYIDDEGKYNVLMSDGSYERFNSAEDIDFLDSRYLWRLYYVFTEKDQNAANANYEYYFVRPTEDLSKSIALIDANDESLIQSGANNIAVIPNGDGTYTMEGYSSVGAEMPYLYFDGSRFRADVQNSTRLTIFTQDDIKKYQFSVRTADSTMGLVYGKDKDGIEQNGVAQFVTRTKDSGNNNWGAQAKAIEESAGGQYRYLFDYFDLNGVVVPADKVTITNGGRNAKIGADQLEIPYNGSILTAHFKQNPNYVGASRVDSLEAWVNEIKDNNVPLDEEATQKTAEVYDYENRIYRVDLTTRSSLSSFTGTVDLGLILDVSGSMLFPSKLVRAENASGEEIGTKSIRTINNATAWDWRGNPTWYTWQEWGLSPDEEYYVIAESKTKATVFRLFFNQSENAWYRVDASCENSHGSSRKIDAKTVFGADNTDASTTYLIYSSGDNYENGTPITRSFYEKQSIDNTAKTLNQVLEILNIAENSNESPIVRAAWNTYAFNVRTSHPEFVSLQDHNTLSINYTTMGGTRTDKALTDGLNFDWGNSNTKYAILITDGAPQFGSQNKTSAGYDPDQYNTNSYTLQQQTAELVRRIKEIKDSYESRGIKLITVGLSMKDVEMGTQLLYDIADTVNGKRMFFEAESGDELENILLEIVKTFILPCNVYGDVTDKVGEAFYLVDRITGKPLQSGDHISLSGDLTDDLTAAYGTVQEDGKTIKWENQEFTPEGWHGSVYVKAKEDLLGGNMLPTNTGDAVIEAKQYSTSANPGHKISLTTDMEQISNPDKFHPVQNRETPLVNVNELSFLHDETEWTVYLGTEVDPKNQLKRLYDDILIEEVIKKDKGLDTNGDGLPDTALYENGDTDNNWYPIRPDDITDSRETEASTASTRNTFYMKDLIFKLIQECISNGDTTRNDWSSFITKDEDHNDILDWDYFLTEALKENGIVIPYHEYGIADSSNIAVTLGKEIVTGEESDIVNQSPHETTVLSSTGEDDQYNPVEKYTLTVLYSPDYTVLPRGQGGTYTKDYHAGIYGTMYQGHAAGTETSRNTHEINVFAKGISITKTDESFEDSLTGAIFNLYRTARNTDASKETIDGLDGEYTLVAEMDMTENAACVIDPLEQLKENEKYYLVETQSPEGYRPLASPVEVRLIITDTYSTIYEEDENDSCTDISAEDLSNWTQTARIIVEGALIRRYDASGNNITGAGVNADTASDITYYRIANNPGVELPATGGPGTDIFLILGTIFTLAAGALLLRRARYN